MIITFTIHEQKGKVNKVIEDVDPVMRINVTVVFDEFTQIAIGFKVTGSLIRAQRSEIVVWLQTAIQKAIRDLDLDILNTGGF